MLLPSMNTEEIREAIRKDLDWVERYKVRVEKILKEHRRKSFGKGYKSKTKVFVGGNSLWAKHPESFNEWAFSGYYDRYSIEIDAYCYYQAKEGGVLLKYNTEDDVLVKFTPHFLNRYNERLKLNKSDVKSIIDHILRRNSGVFLINQEEEDRLKEERGEDYRVLGAIVDGAALGMYYQEEKLCVMKTFVSSDELFERQFNLRQHMIFQLRDLHDEKLAQNKIGESGRIFFHIKRMMQAEMRILKKREEGTAKRAFHYKKEYQNPPEDAKK